MHILQGGAPKCGNFWLYQIIQQIIAKSGQESKSFIQKQPVYELAKNWDLNYPSQAGIDVLEITDLQYNYRISSIFRMPILDFEEYISQTNHVWTHSPICKRSPELLNLFDKKVYIIRDPRDRAISAAKYYTSEYMLKYYPQEETDWKRYLEKNFDALMLEWVWHVYDHIRLEEEFSIHLVFYESFLADFMAELERLLNYLDIKLNADLRTEIADAISFSTMQKENPKHLKKGTAGYWTEILSDEQIKRADIIAGPLIRFLQYPENKNEINSFSPAPIHSDYAQLKKEIISSQIPLYQG